MCVSVRSLCCNWRFEFNEVFRWGPHSPERHQQHHRRWYAATWEKHMALPHCSTARQRRTVEAHMLHVQHTRGRPSSSSSNSRSHGTKSRKWKHQNRDHYVTQLICYVVTSRMHTVLRTEFWLCAATAKAQYGVYLLLFLFVCWFVSFVYLFVLSKYEISVQLRAGSTWRWVYISMCA